MRTPRYRLVILCQHGVADAGLAMTVAIVQHILYAAAIVDERVFDPGCRMSASTEPVICCTYSVAEGAFA